MVHPLHTAVASQKGMRQLAALHALGKVRDRFPGLGVTCHLGKGGAIEIEISTPRARWWGLGLCHLWIWWHARKVARAAIAECKVDARLRRLVPWKGVRTSQRSSPRSTRPPGEYYVTR